MDRWPMVGRAEEQQFIADVIADPDRPGVLVAGRAGVGKTRLIDEVLSTAEGIHLERITASESVRPLPFGAFARLLPTNLHEVDQIDLLGVLGAHLQRRAEGRPTVLAVDDVHLLDGLSAGFVDYVASRGSATVLLTLRSGSPVPDALDRLCRHGGIPRLELQAISRSEFAEVAERALDGIIENASLERLWETTRGNVLFARELIADLLEARQLEQVHGVWRWAGDVGPAPRLKEAIAARLDGLTYPGRRFLELLSVGEPLALETAEQLAAGEVLIELERRGLIAVGGEGGPSVRFSHPLFGEVLRSGMPTLLRRQLNQELARLFGSVTARTPADLLKLAVLGQGSGERVDPTILAEASQVANRLSDHPLAERLARDSLDQEPTFGAQFELGWSLLHQVRFDEATELFTPLVGSEPDDRARERLADGVSLAMGHGLGQAEGALGLMAEIERSTLDRTLRMLIRCHRASLHAFICQYEEAISLSISAIETDDDDLVFVRSLPAVASSLVMVGKTTDALALTDAGIARALRVSAEFPRAPAWAASSRCTALAFAGHVQEALDFMDGALSSGDPPPEIRARANMYRARFLLFEGRAASAVRGLQEVAVNLRSEPSYGSWALALLAEAEALLGHGSAATAAQHEWSVLRGSDQLGFYVDELRSLAWVAVEEGRLTQAVAELWAAADLAEERGQRCFELVILNDLMRLDEADSAARARDVSSVVEGAMGEAIGFHAEAMLSNRASEFERAATSFSEMAFFMVASELWTKAANAYKREGLQARSTKAARRAQETATLCEGARTRLAAPSDQVDPLSRRQYEVALLAARGASNAEIADELSVSVRTVESHLYAAFAKLGLTTRDELRSALADDLG